MPKYKYSIVRFVPSPTRGERVNLGLIVGSDATSEWTMEIVGRKSRAAKLDDARVMPMISAELERLQLRFPTDDDAPLLDGPEINEEWLSQIASQSQNVIQYSAPQVVLAEDVNAALARLWDTFIVESIPQKRDSLSKRQVMTQYLKTLQKQHLGADHLKSHARLKTGHSTASIDVAVHNGVCKRLTQCWSFQVKDTESVLNEVKAWGWTMRDLRRSGGAITTPSGSIGVPKNVELSVIYATADNTADEFTNEAIEVFGDDEVGARIIPLEQMEQHAAEVETLLHQ